MILQVVAAAVAAGGRHRWTSESILLHFNAAMSMIDVAHEK